MAEVAFKENITAMAAGSLSDQGIKPALLFAPGQLVGIAFLGADHHWMLFRNLSEPPADALGIVWLPSIKAVEPESGLDETRIWAAGAATHGSRAQRGRCGLRRRCSRSR